MNGSWIRMDVGSIFDDKLVELRSKHGLAAEGAYWVAIRFIAQNGGKAKWSSVTSFISSLDSEAKVIAMLEAMLDIGLLKTDSTFIWSDRLTVEMEYAQGRTERLREAGRKGGIAKAVARLEAPLKHRPTDLPTNRPTDPPTDKREPYGSHVRLTKDQFKELCGIIKGGESKVRELIESMNNYLDAGRKKPYRNYRAAIWNWAKRDNLLVKKVDYGESGKL